MSTRISLRPVLRLPRAAVLVLVATDGTGRRGALQDTHDTEEVIERIAALDIGKAELTCCVRVPSSTGSGKRSQEVMT